VAAAVPAPATVSSPVPPPAPVSVGLNLEERIFEGHTNTVISVIQLSDGRLCSGSDDNTLHIWNTATGIADRVLKDIHIGLPQ